MMRLLMMVSLAILACAGLAEARDISLYCPFPGATYETRLVGGVVTAEGVTCHNVVRPNDNDKKVDFYALDLSDHPKVGRAGTMDIYQSAVPIAEPIAEPVAVQTVDGGWLRTVDCKYGVVYHVFPGPEYKPTIYGVTCLSKGNNEVVFHYADAVAGNFLFKTSMADVAKTYGYVGPVDEPK